MKLSERLINNPTALETITTYWAGFLDDSKETKFDNGCDDQYNQMSAMMAMMNKANSETPDDSKVNAFKSALATILLDDTEHISGLSVDYNPDHYLNKALVIAGLTDSAGSLPWKTNMSFDGLFNPDDAFGVRVSEGYGNPYETIFKEDK